MKTLPLSFRLIVMFVLCSFIHTSNCVAQAAANDSIPLVKIKKTGGRKNLDGTVTFSSVKQTSVANQWVLECSGKGNEKCEFYLVGIADGPNSEAYDVQKGTEIAEELYYFFLKNLKQNQREYKITIVDPISSKTFTAVLNTALIPTASNLSNPLSIPVETLVYVSP